MNKHNVTPITRKQVTELLQRAGLTPDDYEMKVSRAGQVELHQYNIRIEKALERTLLPTTMFVGSAWIAGRVQQYGSTFTFTPQPNPWYRTEPIDFLDVFAAWETFSTFCQETFGLDADTVISRSFHLTTDEVTANYALVDSKELVAVDFDDEGMYNDGLGGWYMFADPQRQYLAPIGPSPFNEVGLADAYARFNLNEYQLFAAAYDFEVLAITRLADKVTYAVLYRDGQGTLAITTNPDGAFTLRVQARKWDTFRSLWTLRDGWNHLEIQLEAHPDESWSSIRADAGQRYGQDATYCDMGWYSTIAPIDKAERFAACYNWVVEQAKQMQHLNLAIPGYKEA